MKAATILTPLHTQIMEFLEHIEVERNLSRLTIRNYRHYLSRFADWFSQDGRQDIKELDLEGVRKYRMYLAHFTDIHEKGLTKRTQGYHVIALRSFLKWLIKNDYPVLAPEKIDLPKAESYQMHFLDRDKLARLMSQPLLSTAAGLRDRAMLEVLFSTGLRVSELVRLDRSDVDTKRREFGVIGKGRRARVVFLSEDAAHFVDQYLVSRSDPWKPMFIRMNKGGTTPLESGSDDSMRLTTRSVQRIVEKYVKGAKLPIKITPHGLRHSFATDLLHNGAGLRDVQELLGHKNISTTQIYTHVTRADLRSVHEKFHGK
ncbi:MAG TPA: tyrosine-type recombinase/integrase [Patescibacteria group bacterium]|nr:tyrosine-type recombinase/integrase [Patescibacteria group bacterium]